MSVNPSLQILKICGSPIAAELYLASRDRQNKQLLYLQGDNRRFMVMAKILSVYEADDARAEDYYLDRDSVLVQALFATNYSWSNSILAVMALKKDGSGGTIFSCTLDNNGQVTEIDPTPYFREL